MFGLFKVVLCETVLGIVEGHGSPQELCPKGNRDKITPVLTFSPALAQSSSTTLADFATLNDTSTFVQHQNMKKVSEETQDRELHSVDATSLLHRELIQGTVELSNSALYGSVLGFSPCFKDTTCIGLERKA